MYGDVGQYTNGEPYEMVSVPAFSKVDENIYFIHLGDQDTFYTVQSL